MDIILNPFSRNMKRYWRRRKYERVDGTKGRRNVKVVRFGGTTTKRSSWRFRVVRKLHLRIVSPIKLWTKFKNAYINMMLHLAGNNNGTTTSVFGGKRIPKARQVTSNKYTSIEFQNRLVFEIYKNLVPSMELYNN